MKGFVKNKKALWNLYNLSKSTTLRPSDLLELKPYFEQEFFDDCLIARLNFDKAVIYFGNKVESLLLERDEKHNPIYKLEDILEDKHTKTTAHVALGKYQRIKGAVAIVKSKVGKK